MSTAYDSATNGYSSSSNDASKKNVTETSALLGKQQQEKAAGNDRLKDLRPAPVLSTRQQMQTVDMVSKTELNNAESVSPSLKEVPSKVSLRREPPQLDRENIVAGHLKKFLAHIETREIKTHADSTVRSQAGLNSDRSKASRGSKSSDSGICKDNEDPTARIENKKDCFDPKELREEFDGWGLYKKMRISFAPVRRYQYMVDQDYKKNKVTVCAHVQNIYNSFNIRRGRPTLQMNNYFDIDRWMAKMEGKKESRD